MPCRATQDGRVMVESSDKTWSTGEGNGKPIQYSCLENPMNSMKRQKDSVQRDRKLNLLSAASLSIYSPRLSPFVTCYLSEDNSQLVRDQ